MSLPLLLAAKFLRLKIYLLEPNQVLGRANINFLLGASLVLLGTIISTTKIIKRT